jgi:hypothetical protein
LAFFIFQLDQTVTNSLICANPIHLIDELLVKPFAIDALGSGERFSLLK